MKHLRHANSKVWNEQVDSRSMSWQFRSWFFKLVFSCILPFFIGRARWTIASWARTIKTKSAHYWWQTVLQWSRNRRKSNAPMRGISLSHLGTPRIIHIMLGHIDDVSVWDPQPVKRHGFCERGCLQLALGIRALRLQKHWIYKFVPEEACFCFSVVARRCSAHAFHLCSWCRCCWSTQWTGDCW